MITINIVVVVGAAEKWKGGKSALFFTVSIPCREIKTGAEKRGAVEKFFFFHKAVDNPLWKWKFCGKFGGKTRFWKK